MTHVFDVKPHVVGFYTVDAHTVSLQSSHGKITQHYARYCSLAFFYVHKCELFYLVMMLNFIRTK